MKSIGRPLFMGTAALLLLATSLYAGTTTFGGISAWGGSYTVSTSTRSGGVIYGQTIHLRGQELHSFPFPVNRIPTLSWSAAAELLAWSGPLDEKVGKRARPGLSRAGAAAAGDDGTLRGATTETGRFNWDVRDEDWEMLAMVSFDDEQARSTGAWRRIREKFQGNERRNTKTIHRERTRPELERKEPSVVRRGPGDAAWSQIPNLSEEAHRAWLGAGLLALGLAGRARRTQLPGA